VDSTLYIAPDRLAITAGEPFDLGFYHPAKTHPFLAASSLHSAHISSESMQARLTVETVFEPVDVGPLHATFIRFSFPFETEALPMVFNDATLTLTFINGQTVTFDAMQAGLFGGDTLLHFSVEQMAGIFTDEVFEGLYLSLKNQSTEGLDIDHLHLGFDDLWAQKHAIRTTTDPFTPGQRFNDYSMSRLAAIEPGETVRLVVPFPADSSVTEVPVCVGILQAHGAVEECLAPFLFVQRQTDMDVLIAGTLHD
jgi:hypothetical protein